MTMLSTLKYKTDSNDFVLIFYFFSRDFITCFNSVQELLQLRSQQSYQQFTTCSSIFCNRFSNRRQTYTRSKYKIIRLMDAYFRIVTRPFPPPCFGRIFIHLYMQMADWFRMEGLSFGAPRLFR